VGPVGSEQARIRAPLSRPEAAEGINATQDVTASVGGVGFVDVRHGAGVAEDVDSLLQLGQILGADQDRGDMAVPRPEAACGRPADLRRWREAHHPSSATAHTPDNDWPVVAEGLIVLRDPWLSALELAWEAFLAGTTPIGAVVTNADGAIVSEGRGRRLNKATVPGQLSNTRIAHAEVNALAQLPVEGAYRDHALWATVEPCCLCMGAAIQTGIGNVAFAQTDPYAGATTAMRVANPQFERRSPAIAGPAGGVVGILSDLLMIRHYRLVRADRLPFVLAPLEADRPEVFRLAAAPQVSQSFVSADSSGESVATLTERLRPSLEQFLDDRP